MLPRKLHLEQINRFHDKMEELEKVMDSEDHTQKLETSMTWYKLHKHWRVIDDAVEHTKDILDAIKDGETNS